MPSCFCGIRLRFSWCQPFMTYVIMYARDKKLKKSIISESFTITANCNTQIKMLKNALIKNSLFFILLILMTSAVLIRIFLSQWKKSNLWSKLCLKINLHILLPSNFNILLFPAVTQKIFYQISFKTV